MESQISIKIDYNSERKNPEDIFSAMALYISAQKKYGNLLADSLDFDVKYELVLSDIEKGSIKSILNSVANGLGQFINNQSMSLINDLICIDELDSTEKIESLIERQESKIKEECNKISPHLDKVKFAEIISDISSANQLLEKGEEVVISHKTSEYDNIYYLNTKMRVSVAPEEMLIKGEHIINTTKDYLDVIKPVNFGDSQWLVRSRTTGKQYLAFMEDKPWLNRYQTGKLPVITAKYCMIAIVKLDVFKTKRKTEIKRAEILKVVSIVSSDEVQNDLL
ncbi:hypothetical protein [Lelliottia amnigena]|uniref:hypothetical protein n=3 Tax=Lelliottia amnigena TaxID=61646 RepID=UPI001EF8E8BE|nr:hypothetical protein [Lelliottia amnigena]MCG7781893.1 hypothetical protein [Lelliottia amnigena]